MADCGKHRSVSLQVTRTSLLHLEGTPPLCCQGRRAEGTGGSHGIWCPSGILSRRCVQETSSDMVGDLGNVSSPAETLAVHGGR